MEGESIRISGEPELTSASATGELFTLKLRYKEPDGDTSQLLSYPISDEGLGLAAASDDFRFAASVASFAMILTSSEHVGDSDLDDVRELAMASQGRDDAGYRESFLELVDAAQAVSARNAVHQD